MQKYRNSWYWTFKGFFLYLFGGLAFDVLVGGFFVGFSGWFFFFVFKSTDTVLTQAVLILELKTSVLSETQPFRPLLDFLEGWWGFVRLFALWFGVFFFFLQLIFLAFWSTSERLEIRRNKTNTGNNLLHWPDVNLHYRFCDRISFTFYFSGWGTDTNKMHPLRKLTGNSYKHT